MMGVLVSIRSKLEVNQNPLSMASPSFLSDKIQMYPATPASNSSNKI